MSLISDYVDIDERSTTSQVWSNFQQDPVLTHECIKIICLAVNFPEFSNYYLKGKRTLNMPNNG